MKSGGRANMKGDSPFKLSPVRGPAPRHPRQRFDAAPRPAPGAGPVPRSKPTSRRSAGRLGVQLPLYGVNWAVILFRKILPHLLVFAPFRMSQKFTVCPLFDDLSTVLGILKVYMIAAYSKRNAPKVNIVGIYGGTK